MPDPLTTTRVEADNAVTTAEQEAREATGLVTALEERVRDGDDTVTPEQIAAARELGHFAQLRTDATARKAVDAKRTARLAALAELKADIDAYTETTDTDQLVDNIFGALLAYTQHFDAHNARITQWRARMTELDVPKVMAPYQLTDEHGHLGRNGHELYVGTSVYAPVDHKGSLAYNLEQLLAGIRHLATHPSGPRHEQARATAQEYINKVKAAARSGARTQKGQSA
ncbi:hypothetical protein [Streptomyces clavifer]|uniref:hypothetical protein n=1 Tax=Streptomyces clavifer TaxID=68188 RepID=UPI003650F751